MHQKGNKKAPGQALFWGNASQIGAHRDGLGHEHGDERQQENQHRASRRQHDGHEWHEGFHHVLFAGVGGVVRIGHVQFLKKLTGEILS